MTKRFDTTPQVEGIHASPSQLHLESFEDYLKSERGLAQATIDRYRSDVLRFLNQRFETIPPRWHELRPTDITDFILRRRREVSPGSIKLVGNALRAFFRFLRVRGDIATDLASAVPSVADWRLSELPKSLEADQVRQLLDSCDRRSGVGQRNYAILLLLARLGLRAGEIVALRLEDLDWKAGEITVRGKGSRRDRLPIPQDVGEALAAYLSDGRPRCESRRVFITARAPHQGFAGSVAVCSIVSRALARAGLKPPRRGAHLLRHTLATQMLRRGASMVEIAQVLRHSSTSTTEIYTKVDRDALRELAQPWPGGGRHE